MSVTRAAAAVVSTVVLFTGCSAGPSRSTAATPAGTAPAVRPSTSPQRDAAAPAPPGGSAGVPTDVAGSVVVATDGGVVGDGPAPLAGVPTGQQTAWKETASANGRTVLWTTGFAWSASVDVSVAVLDQTKLRAALFNGTALPGPGPWRNRDHVPSAAVPSLVATFNGGFLLKHIDGGYFTEGRTVKPLVAGQATLGVRADGRLVLGVYGRDLTNDGRWTSLRQNLPPMVDHGVVSIDSYPGTYWGNDFHNVWITERSAVCSRPDGRLMYVEAGKIDVRPFAGLLVAIGCQTAMELDINGGYPQFAWFTAPGTAARSGVLLDRRMRAPDRSLTGDQKDFIGLFDPATLPAGVIS